MICQLCGARAETKKVFFKSQIGMIVLRYGATFEGEVCKSCCHQKFWEATGTTAILGWWGIISFVLTPIALANNIIQYLACRNMEPPLEHFKLSITDLAEESIDRLEPHAEAMMARLNNGADPLTVVQDIQNQTGVSISQIVLFIKAVDVANPPDLLAMQQPE